jgi:hypothetical protein
MTLTEQSIQRDLEFVAIFSPSFSSREDHIHRAVNQHLLDAGLDTISCSDLGDFIEADGYRQFLDAGGRNIWRGIGLRSDRMEERLATPEDLYPVVARSTHSPHGKLIESGVVDYISSNIEDLDF